MDVANLQTVGFSFILGVISTEESIATEAEPKPSGDFPVVTTSTDSSDVITVVVTRKPSSLSTKENIVSQAKSVSTTNVPDVISSATKIRATNIVRVGGTELSTVGDSVATVETVTISA
ncbi:unnamed protein product [Strongylus vulgaris]|uniref:Uncharacterized protein n=1 Tax=Strongylus vulgaris TaxID=40348 RepID=A0A3P7LB85_STRVU|nr:unnamed protein product [Strongylus vulgaris]